MVRLLEELVGSDLRGFQPTVMIYGGGRNVHVHAPDFSVSILCRVNGGDGLFHESDIRKGRLPAFQQKALVAQVLQLLNLFTDFPQGQALSGKEQIISTESAILAIVHAIIA